MCHTQPCFALKQDVMCGLWYFWMVIHCFAPQLMAHLSSAFFIVMTSSFHSSPTERRWLGFLSCSFSLLSVLGCNWGKNLSHSCYSPKWTGIVSESHFMSAFTVPPLEPDIFCSLLIFSSVTHIDTCIFCYSHHFLLCSYIYWDFQYFLLPFAQTFLFCSICSTFPFCFPLLCLPLLPPSSFTQVVSQRFPQNSIGAVGSAMFLRFVNPAIVSPYEAGILDKKPLPRIERGLKLMSKVRLVNMMALWCSWLEVKSYCCVIVFEKYPSIHSLPLIRVTVAAG